MSGGMEPIVTTEWLAAHLSALRAGTHGRPRL